MSLRAAGVKTFAGEVELLELPEVPPLEAGEVLIEVKAAGVANWDEIVRTGGWDVGPAPPLALGVEAAGEVVEVGPDVEWPAPGTGVLTHPLPLPYQGCWAERLVAAAHYGHRGLQPRLERSRFRLEAGANPRRARTAHCASTSKPTLGDRRRISRDVGPATGPRPRNAGPGGAPYGCWPGGA